jgi:hypothetical protein
MYYTTETFEQMAGINAILRDNNKLGATERVVLHEKMRQLAEAIERTAGEFRDRYLKAATESIK